MDHRLFFSVSLGLFLLVFWVPSVEAQVDGRETQSLSRINLTYPDTVHASPADTVRVPVSLFMKGNWHINSSDPLQDYLIPTEITVDHPGVKLLEVDYPPGTAFNFSFSNTQVLVYSDTVTFPVTISLQADEAPDGVAMTPGRHKVDFVLTYQACTDKKCAPPEETTFTVNFDVSPPTQTRSDTEVFQPGGTSEESVGGKSQQNRIQAAFQRYGLWLGLGFIFLLGLMLNLTPCVYPMVPITVGYFGGKKSTSLFQKILDAMMFVLGLAMMYSLLGTLAGMTDNVLGQVLQQPFMLFLFAGIMVLLAASMFGFYKLRVPASVRRGSEKLSQGLGTFGMGMTLGLVAAPCLAPATITLMAYISQQQEAYMGGLLFFVLSLGLGFPYLFLAVFASSLSDLPGSGDWLKWVNKLIGFTILGVAIYFLWPLMSLKTFGYLLIALTVIGAIVLGVVHPPGSSNLYYARAVGLAVLAVVFIAYADRTLLVAYEGVNWIPAEKLIKKNEGNLIQGPTLVYVSADWCAPCKKMEMKTFPSASVKREFRTVTPVKVDLTNAPSDPVDAWLQEMSVKGVPTMIFLQSNGQEIKSLRTVGFVGPSILTNKLRVLRRRSNDSE